MRQARVPRCHVDATLVPGERQRLDARSEHHVARVLRMRSGDSIVLFNGDGHDYPATLVTDGRRIDVEVHARTENRAESPLHLSLIQAISRGERMERSLRQAVELGATMLRPIHTRHSVSPLDAKRASKKHEHWQRIIVSAAEQCGRSRIPVLASPLGLKAALTDHVNRLHDRGSIGSNTDTGGTAAAAAAARRYILVPGARHGLDSLPGDGAAPIELLIGPESGFDDDEIMLATDHGFEPLHLGPRILRTETAGPIALALIQARFGDMR